MQPLVLLIPSFSVAIALNLVQIPVEPADNSEVVEASISNGNDAMPNPDALNLAFNVEMPEVNPIIPEAKGNDPVSSSDVKPLFINWGIPEAYSDNPLPEPDLDAPGPNRVASSISSTSAEDSNFEEDPNPQSSDPTVNSNKVKLLTLDGGTQSNSPVSVASANALGSTSVDNLLISTEPVDENWNSNDGQEPNGSDNLTFNLAEDCTVDDVAASEKQEMRTPLSCPSNVFYHKRTGQPAASYGSRKAQEEINTARARRDHRWYLRNFKQESDPPRVSEDFEDICSELSEKLNSFATHKAHRLLVLCCLGPSYLLEKIFLSPTISVEVTDEDKCGLHFPNRPLCENIEDQFCCERRSESLSRWFWKGWNCVPMR